MKLSKRKKLAALVLAAAMILLSACKDSPALTRYIYTPDAEIQGDVVMARYDDVDDSQERNNNASKKSEEAQALEDQQDTPQQGEAENEQAAQTPALDLSVNSGAVIQSLLSPDQQGLVASGNLIGSAAGMGGKSDPKGDPGAAPDTKPSTPDTVPSTPDTVPSTPDTLPSTPDTLPSTPDDNVYSTAAAVGEIATIVRMLGWEGALVATSQSVGSRTLISQVFSDISDVPTVWTGDGSDGLDVNGFNQLLEIKPDVVYYSPDCGSLTQNQIDVLGENGIAVTILDSMNYATGVKNNVLAIGQQMGEAAKSKSMEYEAWFDATISKPGRRGIGRYSPTSIIGIAASSYGGSYINANYDSDGTSSGSFQDSDRDPYSGGMATLFISDWDDTASYYLAGEHTADGREIVENGMAVANTGYTNSPISYYMSMGGVSNTGARASNETYNRTYYVASMTTCFVLNSGQYDVRSDLIGRGGDGAHYTTSIEAYCSYLGADKSYLSNAPEFPAVVVANQNIKNRIESSNFHWKVHDRLVESSVLRGYKMLGTSRNYVASAIQGDYDVYVNPDGVGSWMEGSAESPLETLWITNMFHGSYFNIGQEIYDFYNQFYGYQLSNSQIDAILAGSQS